MKRVWEVSVFLGAAIVAHLAIAAVTVQVGEDAAPGGAGGGDPVTLAAMTPEVAALVDAWDAPPEIRAVETLEAASPPAPPVPSVPGKSAEQGPARLSLKMPRTLDRMAAVPEEALPAPDRPPLASFLSERDAVPPADLAASDRPAPRPDRTAARPERTGTAREPEHHQPAPEPSSDLRAEQRQADRGDGAVEGGAEGASAATASRGPEADALQRWAARIQHSLQRSLVYPRQAQLRGITGRAVVDLVLAADGSVRSRRLSGSSGSGLLDQAALRAIDRASDIPAAPRELAGDSFSFELPVLFQLP